MEQPKAAAKQRGIVSDHGGESSRHVFKLQSGRFSSSIWKILFAVRKEKPWDRLCGEDVSPPSLEGFREA